MQRLHNKKRFAALAVIFLLTAAFGCLIQTSIVAERALLNEAYYARVLEETELTGLRDQILDEVARDLRQQLLWDESIFHQALQETVQEEWIKDRVQDLIAEYLSLVRGEQETMKVELDLQQQIERLKAEIKAELEKRSPEELDLLEVSERDLEEFMDEMLEMTPQVTLVEISENGDSNREVGEAVNRVRGGRAFLHTTPYLGMLALLVLGGFLTGPVGLLKLAGAGMLTSGALYLLLWRTLGDEFIASFLNALAGKAGEGLLADAWLQVGELFLLEIGSVIVPVSSGFMLAGAILLALGLAAAKMREQRE